MDDWLQQPSNQHVLQIYRKQDDLISTLTGYVGQGLRDGDNCIVIATTEHIVRLEENLRYMHDLQLAAKQGRYVVVDAERALRHFMVDGMPDDAKFRASIGRLIHDFNIDGHSHRPVRAFGEMVALLWREGNTAAVMKLENMWNRLAEEADFSLLCAYPELHFMFDRNVRFQVARRHDRQLSIR